MADNLEKLANSGVRLGKAIAMGPAGLAETLSGKAKTSGKKTPPKPKRSAKKPARKSPY